MEKNNDFLIENKHLEDTLNILNKEVLNYINKRKEITEYHYEETNHYSLGHPDCITGRFPRKMGFT